MFKRKSLIISYLIIVLIGLVCLSGETLYAQNGNEIDNLKKLKLKVNEYKEQNQPIKLAQTLSKMGLLYTQIEDYKNAIDCYKQSSSLYLQNQHFDDVRKTYSNIGFVYSHKEEYENALNYFNNALKVAKTQNKEDAICGCMTDIAYILTIQQEYHLSINKLLDALKIAQKIDNKQLILKCYSMLMENYKALGINAKFQEYQTKYSQYDKYLKEENNKKEVQDLQIQNLADKERAELEEKAHNLEMQLAEAEKERMEQTQQEELKIRDLDIQKRKVENEKIILEKEKLEQQDIAKNETIKQQLKDKAEKEKIFRIYLFGGSFILFLLLVIIGLLIHSSRKTRKHNKILETKNNEIQQKNNELESKNSEIQQKNEELKAKNFEIIEKNAELTQNEEELRVTLEFIEQQKESISDSIVYAQNIQRSMLVSKDIVKAGIPNSFIFFQPREDVSGDFYWYFNKKWNDDYYQYIAAIDCTGHGVPGAMISMLGYNILDNIMADSDVLHPNEIMERLHLEVRKTLQQDVTSNHDGMDMALCMINKKDQQVEYSGAKNALIYVKDKVLEKVPACKHGIGGALYDDDEPDGSRKFENVVIDATPDTMFYIYSDGYSDQFGGPNNKKFMLGRFRNELLITSAFPIERQEEKLHFDLMEWMHGSEQTDDILVIGFKI